MTVEEPKLPFPNSGRPMVGGRTGTGETLSATVDNPERPTAEDEMPIAFVPPPVAITRVFPGL